jgi:hypothetical protein
MGFLFSNFFSTVVGGLRWLGHLQMPLIKAFLLRFRAFSGSFHIAQRLFRVFRAKSYCRTVVFRCAGELHDECL